MKADKIYLVGFMGAGKSTVARALAKRLDWRVEDIDAQIEQRERSDISSIFRTKGEAYFRELERQSLLDVRFLRGTVVATGGGTFVDARNRDLMLQDGVVVWLDVPFRTVLDRVPLDGRRPLAADRATLEALFQQRRASYALAHVRIDAARGSADTIAEQILDALPR
jgi:shikimate kinase